MGPAGTCLNALRLPVPYGLGVPPGYAEGLAFGLTVTLVAAALDGRPSSPREGTGQGEIPAGWQQRRLGGEAGASGSLGAGALGRVLSPVWGRLCIVVSQA